MAKAKTKKTVEAPKETPKGLDVKVRLDMDHGRLTVKVILLQDGEEIASDYDFVQVE